MGLVVVRVASPLDGDAVGCTVPRWWIVE
jgi:hypothetical protein